MNTLSYPLSDWNWPPAPLRLIDCQPHKPVLAFLNKLQTELQRNLGQMTSGEGKEGIEETPASALALLHQMGVSSEDLTLVRECAPIKHRGRQIVTVVSTTDERLSLLSWRVNADGSVICTGSSTMHHAAATQVCIARARKFVGAYCSKEDHLKLVSWDVSNTGAIYRSSEFDHFTGAITQLKLTALNDELLVTIQRTAEDKLKLISWRLGDDDGFTCLDEWSVGDAMVKDVTVVPLPLQPSEPHLLTLIRTEMGAIKAAWWNVTPAGAITLLNVIDLFNGQANQVTAQLDTDGHLVTAVHTAEGLLQLTTWQIDPATSTLQPLFQTNIAGLDVKQQALLYGSQGLFSLIQTTEGHLQIIEWQRDDVGRLTRGRTSDYLPAHCDSLVYCPELLDGNAPILAAICPSPATLRLMTWRA
jgi:hypothetical protein